MSVRPNPDHAIAEWLHEEATSGAPERLLQATRRQLESTNQRRAWWPVRRSQPMNMTARFLSAIAAVAVVAVIAVLALPKSGGGPGAQPTASPASLTAPSASPPASEAQGTLSAGRYYLRPFAPPNQAIRVSFTVPAGYEAFGNWALLPPAGTTDGGAGLGFLQAEGLFSDPCHWDRAGKGTWPQAGDIKVGPTVDDLVTALRSQRGYQASAATDVVLGGYSGKRIDLQLPTTVDLTSCDNAAGETGGAYFVWGTTDPAGNDLYSQGPGDRFHLWILDVGGVRVIVVLQDFAKTSDALGAQMQSILDSIVIEH